MRSCASPPPRDGGRKAGSPDAPPGAAPGSCRRPGRARRAVVFGMAAHPRMGARGPWHKVRMHVTLSAYAPNGKQADHHGPAHPRIAGSAGRPDHPPAGAAEHRRHGVQASVGLIETYFVGKLGTDALAGMALVFPLLMLIQMVSAGAMGGGILSAVARALGAGRRDDANALVWHAVAIALGLGARDHRVRRLRRARGSTPLMGGSDGSLAAARTYSDIIFARRDPAVALQFARGLIRGTGNMIVPASVTVRRRRRADPALAGAHLRLGPAAAARHRRRRVRGGLLLRRSAARSLPSICGPAAACWRRRPRRRGCAGRRRARSCASARSSSLVSVTTNVTHRHRDRPCRPIGPAAVAGYGTGARLEYLLVPLVFGLGAPLGAMVGTASAPATRARAARRLDRRGDRRRAHRGDRARRRACAACLAVAVRRRRRR